MSLLEVRKLTEEFLNEVVLLDNRVFPESPWGMDSFRDNMVHDYDHPVVAVKEHKAVGYGILRQIDDGEILLVGVDPACRRQGIGREIVKELLALAEPGGQVFLEVRESNTAARKLYASLGFTELIRRKDYYKDPAEDAVIMTVWKDA